jgi:hypothetical protein
MSSTSLRRRAAVAVAGTAMLGLGTLAAASPASASAPQTVKPLASSGCNGDVCISLSTPSGGKVSVHGWAYNTNFYGHFELTGPNGLVKNSTQKWYYAGGAGPTWSVAAVVGQYCMTGWEYYGGHYYNIGRPCENVG